MKATRSTSRWSCYWVCAYFQPGEAMDADGHLLIARMHRLVQELMTQKTSAEDLAARQQAVDALITERDAAFEKPQNQ